MKLFELFDKVAAWTWSGEETARFSTPDGQLIRVLLEPARIERELMIEVEFSSDSPGAYLISGRGE